MLHDTSADLARRPSPRSNRTLLIVTPRCAASARSSTARAAALAAATCVPTLCAIENLSYGAFSAGGPAPDAASCLSYSSARTVFRYTMRLVAKASARSSLLLRRRARESSPSIHPVASLYPGSASYRAL